MNRSATIKAADITPDTRQWLEAKLNIDLTDADEFTVTLRRPEDGHVLDDRTAARQRLLALLERMDAKTKDVPEAEMEAAIADAMAFVRSQSA